MRIIIRATVFALVVSASLVLGKIHAQGPAPSSQQPPQMAKITTPACAFLKRQCAALRRLISNIPGMRRIMASHHDPRVKHP